MATAIGILRRVWEFAREIMGDRAYERYAKRVRQQGHAPMSAQEFYLNQLQRKYTRPSRCC
jgi:uncharacterized short protein YbdD (DUF466 family)